MATNTENNFHGDPVVHGGASCPSQDHTQPAHGQLMTPSPTVSSYDVSPTRDNDLTEPVSQTTRKKKKKKKAKKPTNDAPGVTPVKPVGNVPDAERASVLCISRNKHWRYISSYHGPWLQLPLELLESLLNLNLDPTTLSVPESHLALPPAQNSNIGSRYRVLRFRERDRGFPSISDYTPPDSPGDTFTPLPPPHVPTSTPSAFPLPIPGKPTPPPIDPGVFRNVTAIRRLIDEAAELSVRASSGLSATASGRNGMGSSAWATAQALGLDGLGNFGGGRNVAMSAMRVHRLRALAVQKLAAAYKADEVASSLIIMQGGSVFDDIAEKVLKHDPNDADAKYVHFFHEKIPSRINRQLAESTNTQVLDELIAVYPQRLEYYRTRGIVHCFRDEHILATKDFTYALKEARTARKARVGHRNIMLPSESRAKSSKKKKGSNKTHGQAPPNGTSSSAEGAAEGGDGESLPVHPSVLPDAPDPIEPQLLFLRGAAYFQHAIHLIESEILKLEGVRKTITTLDGTELRLCYLDSGRYGGVEVGNPDGPLGRSDSPKARAYRGVLAEQTLRDDVCGFLRKSIRDHERFLAHFDTIEGPAPMAGRDAQADLAKRVEVAFLLTESLRSGHQNSAAAGLADVDSILPTTFTTYHPLLVESLFSILICQLMLAELPTLLTTFARTAVLVDGLEGYPVFLPPRSMAQAEFIEVLERLAAGWRTGIQPHSAMRAAGVAGRLTIEGPPSLPPASLVEVMSSASGSSGDTDASVPLASTSSCVNDPPGSISHIPGRGTPSSFNQNGVDFAEALDCARILLVPVAARQKERAEKAAAEKKSGGNKKKPLNINIPLHGPRVEIILAWLAAVHLVELEGAV